MFIAEQTAVNQQYVDFELDQDYDFIKLITRHVAADIQPSSALTMYFGSAGSAIDTSSKYMNTGIMSWGGEPNPTYAANPLAIGLPQTLNLGCRIGIDVGERESMALNANVDITSFGSLSGTQTSPIYTSLGWIGFVGGAAGVSIKPAYLGGGPWFPQDPYGTPFDWSALCTYGGHYDNSGFRVRKIRLSMDGGGTTGRLIKQGYFRVEAMNRGNLPPPPPPGVTFTPIGNFNNAASTFDGITSKGPGSGAWTVGTQGWIGKTGSAPWPANTVTVYGSAGDGFVFGHPPTPFATITAKLYESDSIPTSETDGTLVDTKTTTDTDVTPYVTLSASGQNKLSRWVVISHNQASTSMYVAAIV